MVVVMAMVIDGQATQTGSQGIFGNGVANISSEARKRKNFVAY